MFHQRHPVNVFNPITSLELLRPGTTYPIGMTVDAYLDFISDIKSLRADIGLTVVPLPGFTRGVTLTDLMEELSAIQILQGYTSYINTESKRQILPIGRVKPDLTPVTGSQATTSLCVAPYFKFSGSPGVMVIDCTRTKFSSTGLLYPFIEITLRADIGSNVGGMTLATIRFLNFGDIPIYGPLNLLLENSIALGGGVQVKDRFSDIIPSSQSVSVGQDVTFTAPGMKDLSRFSYAFLNETSLSVSSAPSSLTVTIPQNAKTGCIRFEQLQPVYDSFLTDRIVIS